MPRVSTFLKTIASYHTTIPNVKDVENSKKQPKVGRFYYIYYFIGFNGYKVEMRVVSVVYIMSTLTS